MNRYFRQEVELAGLAMAGALAIFTIAAQCQPKPTPPPPGPDPIPTVADAAPPDSGPPDALAPDSGAIDPRPDDEPGDRCERGYEAARRLGYEPRKPRTGTWVEACRNAEARGLDMQPDCAARASSRAEVERCFTQSPDD